MNGEEVVVVLRGGGRACDEEVHALASEFEGFLVAPVKLVGDVLEEVDG